MYSPYVSCGWVGGRPQRALSDSFAAFDSSGQGLVCAASLVEVLEHAGLPIELEDVSENHQHPLVHLSLPLLAK